MLKEEDLKYFEKCAGFFSIYFTGNLKVGKSSLITKYIHNLNETSSNLCVNANINSNYVSQYRRNFGNCLVSTKMRLNSPNSSNIHLQMYDQKIIDEDSFTTFIFSNAVIFVYDITCQKSFEDIKSKWLPGVAPHVFTDTPFFLVGNKKDTDSDFIADRKVSFEDGLKFAETNNMHFFELSVFLNENVNELFSSLLDILLTKEIKKRKKHAEEWSKKKKQKLTSSAPVLENAIELSSARRKICVIS